MAFDINTAKPYVQPEKKSGFDISTAKPLATAADVPVISDQSGAPVQPIQQGQAPIQQAPQQPQTSFVDKVLNAPYDTMGALNAIASIPVGTMEAGLAALSKPTTGLLGQMAGFGGQYAKEVVGGTLGTPEADARLMQAQQQGGEALTYSPRTQEGQSQLGGINQAINAVGSLIPEDVSKTMIAASPLTAELGMAGQAIKQAAPLPVSIGQTIGKEAALLKPISQENIDIINKLKSGSTENKLAPYELKVVNPNLKDASGKLTLDAYKVVDDPVAKDALKQGWSDGTVQALKTLDQDNAAAGKQMLDIAENSRKDATYATDHRPTDVIGNALEQKIKFLKTKNKEAGSEINAAAEKLKTEKVDVSQPVDQFISDLESKLNVQFKRKENGDLVFDSKKKPIPIFKDSDIEGDMYKPSQKYIETLLDRMSNTRSPSAYDVHRLKKSIDDTVHFGKTNNSNFHPQVENIAKSLRHNLDDLLDRNFDSYNQANIKYRDTAQALGDIQDASGKQLDLFAPNADRQLGTLSRRLMSDVQSRQQLSNAIDSLQSTAAKYGNSQKIDINKLGKFGTELQKIYQITPHYSFAGQSAVGVAKGLGDVARSNTMFEAVAKAAGKGLNYVNRVTPENTYESMKKLLDRQATRKPLPEAQQ